MEVLKKKDLIFEESYGFILTWSSQGGRIIAIKQILREIKLGQRVYSNGNFAASTGTLGLVVAITPPFKNGRTTDIIQVWFEGDSSPSDMKFTDLRTQL